MNKRSTEASLEILRKYIASIDPAAYAADAAIANGIISKIAGSNYSDYMYTDDDIFSMTEPEKKEITFTLAELQAIIESIPQPGGYIHIDDLLKAIQNGGDTK